MNNVDLLSLFFLGLIGTGHCIGMCGPLVVAIPGRTQRFSAHLFYHFGRTITYVCVGTLMGGLGAGIGGIAVKIGTDPLLVVAKIQVIFSLAAAGFLFWFGLSRIGLLKSLHGCLWHRLIKPRVIKKLFDGRLFISECQGSF
jgi:uncharacterized protein